MVGENLKKYKIWPKRTCIAKESIIILLSRNQFELNVFVQPYDHLTEIFSQ